MKLGNCVLGAAVLLLVAFGTVQKINAVPTLQVGLTLEDMQLCAYGNAYVYGTATASGGTGPYTFAWGINSNQISSATSNPNNAYATTATGSVTMTVYVWSSDGQSANATESISGLGFCSYP